MARSSYGPRLSDWLWAVVVAAPIMALYVFAHRTTGWISTVAYIAVGIIIVALLVLAFVHEGREWARFLDDHPEE
jgi:uncharacterized membrane protein YczE